MSDRSVGLAAALAVVLLVLAPAGALSGVFASDVTSAGLVIEKGSGPNGEYAKLSDEELALDLSAGVSNNAVTSIDAVFTVTNDRSYAAPVWLTDETDALTFYDTATGDSVEGARNNVSLAPGETLVVGVRVDTTQTNVSELEQIDSFTVETMVKDATVTAASNTTSTATSSGDTSADTTGGGQSGGSDSASVEVVDTREGATINVRDASSGERIEAPLHGGGTDYVTGSGITVDEYTMQLYFANDRFRVEATDPTDGPQQAPALDGPETLGYFRLENYHVEQAELEDGNVTFTVDSLPSGADASDVTLYRHTDSGWKRIETSQVDEDTYTADADGFGEFAVAVDTSGGGTDGTGGTGGTSGTADGTQTSTPSGGDNANPSGTATQTPTPTPTGTPMNLRREMIDAPHVTLTSGIAIPTVLVLALFTLALASRVHRRR